MKKKIVFLGLIVFFLIGCGNDPKAANDKNFTKVIKSFVESDKVYVIVKLDDWGSISSKDEEGYPQFAFRIDSLDKYKENLALYDYWIEIGFMEKSEYEEKSMPFWGNKEILVKKRKYILSEKGKKEYDKDKNGLVIGKVKFDKLQTWSEPADMFGYRVSEVKYLYRIDINKGNEWAKDLRVRDKIRIEGIDSRIGRDKDIQEQFNGKMVLVLTGEGWITEKEMNE